MLFTFQPDFDKSGGEKWNKKGVLFINSHKLSTIEIEKLFPHTQKENNGGESMNSANPCVLCETSQWALLSLYTTPLWNGPQRSSEKYFLN